MRSRGLPHGQIFLECGYTTFDARRGAI
jgi:hypothetical protein